jgi:dihydrofolate synthase/folylpolyglutamate synthase
MTYAESIQFLYSLQIFGTSFGLERTFKLAALAGNPQHQLRFIHVAGTNGKGSVCAMLESIYRASGLRVGLYTSPHLVSFRERIQVNRELISEADVVRLVGDIEEQLATFPANEHPTFFEVVTVMALRYFTEQKCGLVVWETGLGGRLDATNIVTPLASVITNVQLDHENWLGDTIEAIAREKAGIIKPRVPVITAAEGAALDVIRDVSRRLLAPLTVVSQPATRFTLSLEGEHQRINAAVAEAAVKVLAHRIPPGDNAIRTGLETTDWPARFQVLQRGTQTIVLDGAHNPAGAAALGAALRVRTGGQPIALILGILEDKNCRSVCRALAPLAARIIVTRVASQRSASPGQLAQICREENPRAAVHIANHASEAIAHTRADAFVVIAGSLYLVGEALELLGASDTRGERGLNEWSAPRR